MWRERERARARLFSCSRDERTSFINIVLGGFFHNIWVRLFYGLLALASKMDTVVLRLIGLSVFGSRSQPKDHRLGTVQQSCVSELTPHALSP